MNSTGTSKTAESVDLPSIKDKDSFVKSMWQKDH